MIELFSKLKSRSLSQLNRQIISSIKNDHASSSLKSRKSFQFVNSYQIWIWWDKIRKLKTRITQSTIHSIEIIFMSFQLKLLHWFRSNFTLFTSISFRENSNQNQRKFSNQRKSSKFVTISKYKIRKTWNQSLFWSDFIMLLFIYIQVCSKFLQTENSLERFQTQFWQQRNFRNLETIAIINRFLSFLQRRNALILFYNFD